ncbi:MAG: hypothetical protein ACK41P_07155 [Asticcacaulis sp.]
MTDARDPGPDSNDLAFLKALVSEAPRVQRRTGLIFLIAGGLYGAQCLLFWLQFKGFVPQALGLWITIAPTALLLLAIGWIGFKDRHKPKGGVAQRALEAAWGSAGLTNLFMLIVLAYVSYTEKNFTYWLLYAVMVCIVQGSVWYIAAMIRRKLWLGIVSAGWFLCALGTGLTLRHLDLYILIMAAALFLLMALPGWIMYRQPKEA